MAVVQPPSRASWLALRKFLQLTSGSLVPKPFSGVMLATQKGQRALQARLPATILKVRIRMMMVSFVGRGALLRAASGGWQATRYRETGRRIRSDGRSIR